MADAQESTQAETGAAPEAGEASAQSAESQGGDGYSSREDFRAFLASRAASAGAGEPDGGAEGAGGAEGSGEQQPGGPQTVKEALDQTAAESGGSVEETAAEKVVDAPGGSDAIIQQLLRQNQELMRELRASRQEKPAQTEAKKDPWELTGEHFATEQARANLPDGASDITVKAYADASSALLQWEKYVGGEHDKTAQQEIAKARSQMRSLTEQARRDSETATLRRELNELKSAPERAAALDSFKADLTPTVLRKGDYEHIARHIEAGGLTVEDALHGFDFSSFDPSSSDPGNWERIDGHLARLNHRLRNIKSAQASASPGAGAGVGGDAGAGAGASQSTPEKKRDKPSVNPAALIQRGHQEAAAGSPQGPQWLGKREYNAKLQEHLKRTLYPQR